MADFFQFPENLEVSLRYVSMETKSYLQFNVGHCFELQSTLHYD